MDVILVTIGLIYIISKVLLSLAIFGLFVWLIIEYGGFLLKLIGYGFLAIVILFIIIVLFLFLIL